ncbi:[NiFe]-hydrogenase assembly chaperone HybE [Caldimonas thermodepolymerans]|jgi:[NiFe] hydrogenase assembly HybE family chaperone|uniref:[NiFe] hydrogenase assembly HybE family chaperone n=1 Tax=Caldimonas thermodepolymerans TaxID=215580 RepID=A0A2S5T522_9BURK|nr:[NiFe]-hydrogenase assembly chaperone HybE [Caldimonas thermodepolymerans]PPE70081.1 [NiFe]-hydrogenase assembly, chaperone, HybE [Caldimonas thermodepolymerans]QPC31827.1 [NiFe]-hydrogenase assembly chaperone HybE [Caldimonas thermodepolymerans]RDI01667.1 [NiFe] hydrogenase assembly HybE family chaperone [Caldimonas thermodepolymerans]TCP05804.1 [NiFe] hydrogenase assembly HybE family chaperone [Caldimonas thermodepolymerans]UZG44611.1 [NiFe]-hydrogenase assembly chaperone HybE [Caldimonas
MSRSAHAAPAADPSGLLVQAYGRIARTRMAGLPMCHPGLGVEAVGFHHRTLDGGEAGWLGVLVTPWCMNLVWRPDDPACVAAPGRERTHRLGEADYGFIGAQEDGMGRFEACSLFSPMFEFEDMAAARAVAGEVMRLLQAREAAVPEQPARRRFLFGGARPGAAA